ncbi:MULTISPECIES: prohead protease/major capsid protein fusion protein [Brevundimonas]|uniref:prohead protease/major capsid protein fusion protein n=1 Tax=Brevundimonas sp. UBA7507 TaxID=1946137 RepID=UPI00257CB61E|nr:MULTISPECIES: prohead protease/major capsid protein fusion protein [Brevundimonas]
MLLRSRLMGAAPVRAPATDADGRSAPTGYHGQTVQRFAAFAPTTYDAATRSVEVIISTGVRRRTWFGYEELEVSPEACDISRVALGQVRALDHHNDRQIDAVVGSVVEARFEGPNLVGRIVFADTDIGRKVEGMVARGELTGISCGYTIETFELVGIEDDREIWRATRWSLMEVSFVSVPADANAGVRSAGQSPGTPGEPADPQQENETMRTRLMGGAAAAALSPNTDTGAAPVAPTGETATRAAAPAAQPVPSGVGLTDGLRLLEQARSFGADVETQIRALVTDPAQTVQSVESAILAAASRAQAAQTAAVAAGAGARVSSDERETQSRGMVDALVSRMTHAQPTDIGRQYRGLRIVDLMAERNGIASRNVDEIIERSVGMHTTSDFPNLLQQAASRVLLASYTQAQPIYRTFSARRNFQDFRPHSMLRIGEFPLLEEVNQSGEIKSGTIPESAEKVGLKTRGRNIALTRQALINDDLGAFADMAAAAGRSAARTEDKVAFDGLLSNNGKGLKLADGKTLYHADHGNLAAASGAISETTVDAGNQAIRFQKGLGDEVLDYSPAILLVGPKQELAARKFVAVVNAVSQDEFNPWAGRLRVEVTARITNNSWRLFTDPNELAAFVYGYLRDAEGPMVSQHEPFNQDGIVWKVLHDFAFGAVDHRGTWLNEG